LKRLDRRNRRRAKLAAADFGGVDVQFHLAQRAMQRGNLALTEAVDRNIDADVEALDAVK